MGMHLVDTDHYEKLVAKARMVDSTKQELSNVTTQYVNMIVSERKLKDHCDNISMENTRLINENAGLKKPKPKPWPFSGSKDNEISDLKKENSSLTDQVLKLQESKKHLKTELSDSQRKLKVTTRIYEEDNKDLRSKVHQMDETIRHLKNRLARRTKMGGNATRDELLEQVERLTCELDSRLSAEQTSYKLYIANEKIKDLYTQEEVTKIHERYQSEIKELKKSNKHISGLLRDQLDSKKLKEELRSVIESRNHFYTEYHKLLNKEPVSVEGYKTEITNLMKLLKDKSDEYIMLHKELQAFKESARPEMLIHQENRIKNQRSEIKTLQAKLDEDKIRQNLYDHILSLSESESTNFIMDKKAFMLVRRE